MLIAVDYDKTISADPEFFDDFFHLARRHGHKCYVVTMRSKELDWDDEFLRINFDHEIETVFCDGLPKRKYCEEQGLNFDWWFDDWPEGIHLGSVLTPEQLAEWREENVKST